MKKIILIFAMAIFLTSVIFAQGEIINLKTTQELPNFVAGEVVSTQFTFKYPDLSSTYPNQMNNAPLVFVINITSSNPDYPVWKGDFQINGTLDLYSLTYQDKNYRINCFDEGCIINYPFGPVEIRDIPPGVFYCTNSKYLVMPLNSEAEVELKIKSNPALWPGEYNYTVGLFYPEQTIFEKVNMTLYNPLGGIYNTRKIYFNLTTSSIVEGIYYVDWSNSRPRFQTLCSDCDGYGFLTKKYKSFTDGNHTLTFRSVDKLNQFNQINVSIFIDTKSPQILKTYPARNDYSDGGFSLEFNEDNVEEIILYYGNKSKIVNLDDCYEYRKKKICNIDVNLLEYDGKEISYYFKVEDIAGNTDESKITKTKVDLSSPVVNYFEHSINGKKVNFLLNITEANFKEVNYQYIDSRGKLNEGNLCLKLNKGLCEKTKYFSKGNYEMTINILDDAGNKASFLVDFSVL